jgi:hypothetical protein
VGRALQLRDHIGKNEEQSPVVLLAQVHRVGQAKSPERRHQWPRAYPPGRAGGSRTSVIPRKSHPVASATPGAPASRRPGARAPSSCFRRSGGSAVRASAECPDANGRIPAGSAALRAGPGVGEPPRPFLRSGGSADGAPGPFFDNPAPRREGDSALPARSS